MSAAMSTTPERKTWTRPQLLIALNLYHKVSFGMFHAKNKMLVDISRRMRLRPGLRREAVRIPRCP